MSGVVQQLAALAVLWTLLMVAGAPLTLLALPRDARPWWPVAMPVLGLATTLVVVAPLSLVAGIERFRLVLAIGLLACAAVAVGLWRKGVPRPAPAAMVALSVCVVVATTALGPSLDAGVARAPAIVIADSFFYAVDATWLETHASDQAPPAPPADPFLTPAFVAHKNPLRVGSELVLAGFSTVLGQDAATLLPALTAILAALGVAAVVLALRMLGAPAWACVAAAVLVAARPEGIRLALDSGVAQTAGSVLLPVVLAASWTWLRAGSSRAAALSVVCSAALSVAYPEYLPFACLVLGIAVLALLLPAAARQAGGRRRVLGRAALVAAGGALLALPQLSRAVESLTAIAGLGAQQINEFRPAGDYLALAFGPGDIYHAISSFDVVLAAVLLVGAIGGLVALARLGHAGLMGGIVIGAAILILRVRVLHPYDHALDRLLALLGPLLMLLAAAGLAALSHRLRLLVPGVTALAVVAVVGFSHDRALVAKALASPYAPASDDIALRSDTSLFPDGRRPVALEGVSHDGVPMGRLHWALYELREGQGAEVGFDYHISYLLSASYENPRVYVSQSGMEAYRADYGYVLSFGRSPTHSQPFHRAGRYFEYRRDPVDLLLAGWPWRAPVLLDGVRAFVWNPSVGPPLIHVSAEGAHRARFEVRILNLNAPRVGMKLDGHPIMKPVKGRGAMTLRTGPIALSPGAHELVLDVPPPADPAVPYLAVVSARAQP
jgi:hypothetical protein